MMECKWNFRLVFFGVPFALTKLFFYLGESTADGITVKNALKTRNILVKINRPIA